METIWIFDRLKKWNNDLALVCQDKEYTYRHILKAVDSFNHRLDANNVNPGNVVALEGDYSLNTCALLLALIEKKTISVPLTENTVNRRDCFIKTAEAQFLFSFLNYENGNLDKLFNVVKNPVTRKFIAQNEPGLVLFSSGSTGENKAVLHNFTRLMEKFKVLRRRMRTINFLLFDHIGGINTLLYTLLNGGVVVIPHRRSPEKVCELIEKYKVELLPTTPTFLNLLLISKAYKNYDLSSLAVITYGTEIMPASLLKRVHETFPRAKLLQTYGLSELGILRSKSKDSGSSWLKIGGEGFETKIIDDVLWIKADSAMIGYLNAPNPFDEEGWMNTEDIVESNGEFIRFIGRKTDIINVGGQKVYPSEVENVLMQMNNIKDATIWAQKNPIMGNVVAAKILLDIPEDAKNFKKKVRKFCKEKLENYKIPVKIEISDQLTLTDRFKKARK